MSDFVVLDEPDGAGQPSNTAAMSRGMLYFMSFAGALCLANIYYNQPLLEQMRGDMRVSVESIGWVPSLTQAGYALGMLFFIPMGDMLDRKKLAVLFTALSAVCLALTAFAPNFQVMAVASLLLGFTTMTPHLLMSLAAKYAPPTQRGKVVGTMVSGFLLGILLSRTVSGFLGVAAGWRVMFGSAAGVIGLLSMSLAFVLPRSTASFHGSYGGLLKSVFQLVREEPVLREACLFGGVLFGAFSVFWVNLIYLMATPAFNMDARAVGIFGLIGAAAAALAPLIGSLADRRDPRGTTGWMLVLTFVSFLIFWVSGKSLIGLGIGVLLMDIGVQCGHVSNQSRIYSLIPEAQSRLQTAYMFFYFVGGAAGSLIGTFGWSHFQWSGVCVSGMAVLSIAAIPFLRKAPKGRSSSSKKASTSQRVTVLRNSAGSARLAVSGRFASQE